MKILEVYKKKLRFLNYSQRTEETYSCYFEKFIAETNTKDPYQVSTAQITHYLENRHYSSVSQQRKHHPDIYPHIRETITERGNPDLTSKIQQQNEHKTKSIRSHRDRRALHRIPGTADKGHRCP